MAATSKVFLPYDTSTIWLRPLTSISKQNSDVIVPEKESVKKLNARYCWASVETEDSRSDYRMYKQCSNRAVRGYLTCSHHHGFENAAREKLAELNNCSVDDLEN